MPDETDTHPADATARSEPTAPAVAPHAVRSEPTAPAVAAGAIRPAPLAQAIAPRRSVVAAIVRWLAVAFALAGWWLCGDLLVASINAAGSPLANALCGGPDAGDCQSVFASRWGGVRLLGERAPRVPLAAVGMMYFAAVAIWFLFVGGPTRRGAAHYVLPYVVVIAGAAASAHYLRVMLVEIGRVCPACVLVHAINAGVLLLATAAWPWRGPRGLAAHPTLGLAGATIAAAVFAATTHITAAASMVSGGQAQRLGAAFKAIIDDPDYVTWSYERQPAAHIALRADESWMGDPNAPNTVVIFSDFRCERCREAHRLLGELVAANPARVRVALRHMPLDAECNDSPQVRMSPHAGACRAAYAYEAVRRVAADNAANKPGEDRPARDIPAKDNPAKDNPAPGAQQSEPTAPAVAAGAVRSEPTAPAVAAAERLFANAAALDRLDPAALAADAAGAPEAAVRAALPAVGPIVREDIDQARALGVDKLGTPVIFLNGRRVEGWTNRAAWERLLKTGANGSG